MISHTAEYALRAVIFLAQHYRSAHTAQEISRATLVPLPYLSKILNGLVRTNLVTSQRGLGGGFALVVNPTKLTLLEVIDAVEPFKASDLCPPGLNKKRGNACPLHTLLNQSVQQSRALFAKSTVGDLLSQDKLSKQKLCVIEGSGSRISRRS